MTCDQASNDLAAFHDNELPLDRKLSLEKHVEQCDSCRRELQEMRRLSDAARALITPPVSEDAWQRLERRLAAASPEATPQRLPSPRRQSQQDQSPRPLLAIAAMLLVIVGFSWALPLQPDGDDNKHLVIDLDRYLKLFPEDPQASQQVLLTHYQYEDVGFVRAEELLEYRPTVAEVIPAGYDLHKVYVFDMPCCRCVQTVYTKDGKICLCMFEHDEDQPMWFGNLPSIHVQCSGKLTRITGFDGQLVASWQRGKRHMTVIGLSDVDEIAELIRELAELTDAA